MKTNPSNDSQRHPVPTQMERHVSCQTRAMGGLKEKRALDPTWEAKIGDAKTQCSARKYRACKTLTAKLKRKARSLIRDNLEMGGVQSN